jgi:hypothetical protein
MMGRCNSLPSPAHLPPPASSRLRHHRQSINFQLPGKKFSVGNAATICMIFRIDIAFNAISNRTAYHLTTTICNTCINVNYEWIFLYLTGKRNE